MVNQLPYSVSAYRVIRERILALEADLDEETLADTLEGLPTCMRWCCGVAAALLDEAKPRGSRSHRGAGAAGG
jgi:hypothetical protein